MSECRVKQSANTADCLYCRVLQDIGNVMSEENTKITLELYKQKHFGLEAVTLDTISSVIDFRAFWKFIKIPSIILATAFMNAQSEKAS